MEMLNSIEMPEKKTVTVAGIQVGYYESGSGTPLILLHGWPQTSHIWRKVFPELQEKYHVFAIDLPGMGNDNALPVSDTRTVADLIHSFCTELGLCNIYLMAHDIGAWVAATYALEYEKNLKSLIVLDGGIPGLMPDEVFSPDNAQKIWQFYFHAIEGIPEFLIEGKEKEYLNWYFMKKTTVKNAITAADIDIYAEAYTGKERLRNGFDYYRAFTESAAQNKSYQHKLNIPVLAIGAADSQGLNMGKALQKITNTAVTSVSIPECGHYIAEEQPQLLLEIVSKFLA